tara:strand:- start:255 stop:398 length:144 start_codon:yes stop_codon:yes gene_type:complete
MLNATIIVIQRKRGEYLPPLYYLIRILISPYINKRNAIIPRDRTPVS